MSKLAEIADIMARPVDDLVDPAGQVRGSDEIIENWDIPADDRAALIRCGLPAMREIRIVPDIQTGTAPAVELDGRRLYSLGTWGNLEIAAIAETGEVWGLPLVDWLPAPIFINSSVSKFVDIAWRWYWAWRVLKDMDGIEVFEVQRALLASIVRVDEKVDHYISSKWRAILSE